MFYQTNQDNEWKLLKSSYSKNEEKKTGENVREIIFSNKNISVSQFDRPPLQLNTMLMRDTLKWTMNFAIGQISNVQAKEYPNQDGWEVEIILQYTDLPASFESIEKRHPQAPEAPADPPDFIRPGKPDTYPLAKLANNYVKDGVRRVKFQFPRSTKTSGARLWAWPVVVALILGESSWSTKQSKKEVEDLFQLHLDSYTKLPHVYADFRHDGDSNWQVVR